MTKVKIIPPHLAKELQKILDIREGYYTEMGRDDVIHVEHIYFGNGVGADIKVCNGDTPYVDAVLFDNNQEVMMLVSDTILGEYCFEYKGEEYKAILRDTENSIKFVEGL